jgi:predicted AlkP superfamily pyrophosphatase or phosphodiesterase
MNRCLSLLVMLLVLSSCAGAQKAIETKSKSRQKAPSEHSRPKLIVGITVDQMRYDYIERYWNDFGSDGFKRLVQQGFFARNLHYNYAPTVTGPGHAAIFTGTTPAFNGIVANDWYLRRSDRMTYCAADTSVRGIGTEGAAGKMSPVFLQSTTIGDELRLFSNQRSKVIGIALKDRGAILPAGRTANAAYWFSGGDEGNWVSSSWYMEALPEWVTRFNQKRLADTWLNGSWSLFRDSTAYDESLQDNNAYEMPFKGLIRPVFPYDLAALRKTSGNYELLKATPFGNSFTTAFAMEAILEEKLGTDEHSDMLCLSYSATDYIGHQFGMHARETQDCYLRLDQEIATLIDFLDKNLGRDNYLLFLSADHGGAPTPSYTSTLKMSAGYWKSEKLETAVQDYLSLRFGEGRWVLSEVNQNIYLNRTLIEEKKLDLKKIQMDVASFVLTFPEVTMAFNASDLERYAERVPIAQRVQLGFNAQGSGDVIYLIRPDYTEYGMQGTTHGAPYAYDTHVPALFFGANVEKGETHQPQTICDIAATVCALCRISYPSAAIGEPINKIVK